MFGDFFSLKKIQRLIHSKTSVEQSPFIFSRQFLTTDSYTIV